MSKLLAIWRILWADHYAVFTFEDAAPDPTWLTVPTFRWIVCKTWKECDLFWFIRQRLTSIEKYNSDLQNKK